MRIRTYVELLVGFAVLALSGCAITPTTDVRSMDPQFSDLVRKEKIGIVKFDIHAADPDEAASGAAAGAAGGLIGALIYVAAKDAMNEADFTVDSEAVLLHDKSLALLVNRLEESDLVQPVEPACNTGMDPVGISRRVRDNRLYGSKAPGAEEINAFVEKHGLDYALYSTSVAADNPSGEGVFLQSKWVVYDPDAREAVSVLSRSLDASASRKTLTRSEMTERYLSLFNDNIDRLFDAAVATR